MDPDKKLPHQMKTNKWSIVYWLTDGRTIDTLNQLTQNMPSNWALEGQIEQGKDSEGKLHAQLYLKTEQTRGTKIAKYFPQCDIQEAKNSFALQQYVHKEDTRVAEFMTITNRSPSWSLVKDKFFDWVIETEAFYGHIKDDLDDERTSPRLKLWDKFIEISIAEGMCVELVGVNPQYRSAIRRYWNGFIICAEGRLATSIDKKTDKTKDNIVVDPPSQFVEIPTMVAEGGAPCVQNFKKTIVRKV